MSKKMDATASSKKPKRTPKNAARSAHGQRIHNALCEPPTPVPTLSSNNLNVCTRSAARREAAIMAAIPIRSVRAPSASPQGSANSKKEINETKKSVRFALEEDDVVADANTTTTKDKPTPSDNPTQPATTSTPSSTTLTPQRPRPLSAPHILDQLLARNPDFGATHARLRLPSVAPRLLLRPLFADARSGKFSEAAKPSLNEEEQETQEKKKMDKKEKGKLLRKMVASVVHDTRDGRDELTNAGYFLQVLEEVERTRGGSDGADVGAGDERSLEGTMPWLVEEVFKMLVILVSWHRQLAPREEGEDAGCVLSVRQVLELVEGEIEAAARIVHGAV
ncbi:uncharacterized protein LTHEOB_813 [Lasiodiplodia theobromae]|uniref:uncharacterized protein n=1 Tax=Lasiodiplodia theobromae TaxID=45133 RepID=UPI0015C37B8D|nr:uncharacterized protein LTHEOB_813 [Lasiodiplodia theobromae]KAF4540871.1 hypothetical protein LTHEOB_813 [Lasiodiplodia theobromae]